MTICLRIPWKPRCSWTVSGEDVPYFIVGGRTLDGVSCVNPLSHLFVEAIDELHMLKAPVIIVRTFNGIEEDFFQKVCKAMADNASLYVYNDETQIPAFIYYGIAPEDAGAILHVFLQQPDHSRKNGFSAADLVQPCHPAGTGSEPGRSLCRNRETAAGKDM